MKPLAFSTLAAFALTAAAVPAPALAQQVEGPSVQPGSTLLSLNARGKTTATPELAMFSAGVATTGSTAAEALSSNSAAMSRVIRALRSSGIANRDIQTSNLNVSPVYANRTQKAGNTLEQQMPRIIGYRANNQVMVKQRKLDQFGKVIDTLVSAGANQVNGPNFQMEDTDGALDEARRDAVAKARARAKLYAAAAGLRVKRILTISEGGNYSPRPQMAYSRVAMDSSESTPIAVGELDLNVSVSVTFELAP